MINDKAFSALPALAGCLAGILALLINASLFAGAAEIVAASRLAYAILADLTLSTGAIRVTHGATCAAHTAFIREAVLIVTAFSLAAARIAKLI